MTRDKKRLITSEYDSNTPKYEWVKKNLLSYMSMLPADDEYLPYEYELEELFNVSRRTIRRALKDLRDAGIIETVRNHGSRVLKRDGFPNGESSEAVSLAGQVVGAIIYSDSDELAPTSFYPWKITGRLEELVTKAGGSTLICNLRESKWRDTDDIVAFLKGNGVRWAFFTPHLSREPNGLLESLLDGGVTPAIYLSSMRQLNLLSPYMSKTINWVCTNHSLGIYEYLCAKRAEMDYIAYIGSRMEAHWESSRIEVVKRFALKSNIPFREVLLDEPGKRKSGDFGPEDRCSIARLGAAEVLDELGDYSKPLLFGANDSYAVGILNCLEEHGLAVPEIQVLGYDNTQSAMDNNLSSFDLDYDAIGSSLFGFCGDFYEGRAHGCSTGKLIPSLFVKRISTR